MLRELPSGVLLNKMVRMQQEEHGCEVYEN